MVIGEEETGDEVTGMHDFLNDVFVQPLTEEGVGPSTEPPIGKGGQKRLRLFLGCLKRKIKICSQVVRSLRN